MNYTATALAKKLNISRSYLYYLKDKNIITCEVDEKGKYFWGDQAYNKAYIYIKANKKKRQNRNRICHSVVNLAKEKKVQPLYINNRRYLGNKYKLLSFIQNIVKTECVDVESVFDIFAGTGSVASAFLDKKIITNDILYSNYICHLAWFSNEYYDQNKIEDMIYMYNNVEVTRNNYMSKNFSNTYFSESDCKKIGFIREDIEKKYNNKEINSRERAVLITSLLYAMDKIAQTCGHYDAYRQNAIFDTHLELKMPCAKVVQSNRNECYNQDSNFLSKKIGADLVYIDPPYNSRQYCDSYHLLENVAKWKKPEVYGVAKKMNRENLKSDYCTKAATVAFEELIANLKCKYILLSYNNMASKGNDRSNAKISDRDIMRILSKKGEVKVFSENHKAFTTGKSDINNNEERVFLCKVYKDDLSQFIQSPLNYLGGKYQLLPQIEPLFPRKINKLIDLFCGGCNVGINTQARSVIFNDKDPYVYGIIKSFRNLTKDEIFKYLFKQIEHYGLSLSSKYGYNYYGCDSSTGLGKINKSSYLKLRDDFNHMDKRSKYYYVKLFLLLVYSFNNQIRFNSEGDFNLPVGKRDFNNCMQKKLSTLIDNLNYGNYIFINEDFESVLSKYADKESFVYADPPYLITCATYNENGGWTCFDEERLLNELLQLNHRGIKFALSNVLECKGRRNNILYNWIQDNERYLNVHYLKKSYSNSNYQCKNRDCKTKEVLITNY